MVEKATSNIPSFESNSGHQNQKKTNGNEVIPGFPLSNKTTASIHSTNQNSEKPNNYLDTDKKDQGYSFSQKYAGGKVISQEYREKREEEENNEENSEPNGLFMKNEKSGDNKD